MPELNASEYDALRRVAARHSRVAEEADDLLHDALCVATERGRLDLAGADGPWFHGVLANLGLRRARDAVRRRSREQAPRPGATPVPALPDAAFLRALPPAARRVAVLAINGMTPDEIRHVLRLGDAAYRQRLSTVRRAWREGGEVDETAKDAAELDFGLIRQGLLDPVRRRGQIASHDPDGKAFFLGEISSSQTAPPRELEGEAGT